MKKLISPETSSWKELALRPSLSFEDLLPTVRKVFSDVKENGDTALLDYSKKFDVSSPKSIRVELIESTISISVELKTAIDRAYENISLFHAAQKREYPEITTSPGVNCWQEDRAIEKVGLYIPGGSAPLFSTVLMLAIPAQLAGCSTIVLCTPPNQNGEVPAAIQYAAVKCGIKEMYCVGGIQAIAAMTFGTETIPAVYKLFGPGNSYVTAAKAYAQQLGLAIDMPAGPSELLVIADEKANPVFVAADLLSQAEHGSDSQVVVLSNFESKLTEIQEELYLQLAQLPRRTIAEGAIEKSLSVFFPTLEECFAFSNYYAPEHLILNLHKPRQFTGQIANAGSVFLGAYSCESAGDYASGTNHTLPTAGAARSYSGVNLMSFTKQITFQELSKTGVQNLGPTIEIMAEAEELFAHKNAVTVRLKSLQS